MRTKRRSISGYLLALDLVQPVSRQRLCVLRDDVSSYNAIDSDVFPPD
jgi:hypothetical protein